MPRKLSSLLYRLVLFVVAVFASACAEPPTWPSFIPPAPAETPVAPARTYTVTGVVLDSDDVPVAGAEVTFYHWVSPPGAAPPPTRVVTDAQGGFSATLPQPPAEVAARKEGYETAIHFGSSYPRTLRLHKVLVITAGESARLSVSPDDAFCGFSEEFNCRRVHIRAPSDGILVAEVTDEAPPVIFTLSMGELRWPYPKSKRAEAAVAAGDQQFVDILRYWNDRLGPQTLTLRTSLEPR